MAVWRVLMYVAFVINVFSRWIVGWRVRSSMKTDFAVDALLASDERAMATWVRLIPFAAYTIHVAYRKFQPLRSSSARLIRSSDPDHARSISLCVAEPQ